MPALRRRQDRRGVGHREQRAGRQRLGGVLGNGVVRLAWAAGPLELRVAVGLAGHRGVGGLLHVEAELQAVLGFPGGVVGHHLDVLALGVGQRHRQPLADRPAVAGIDDLVAHRAACGDDLAATAAAEGQGVDRAVSGRGRVQAGGIGGQRGGGAQGQDGCRQGRKAHEGTPLRVSANIRRRCRCASGVPSPTPSRKGRGSTFMWIGPSAAGRAAGAVPSAAPAAPRPGRPSSGPRPAG